MKFQISQYEDGTFYQEFTFWENVVLKSLLEYQKILDLGVIEEPTTEDGFCNLIGKIAMNMAIVGDLPFAEYEIEQFESPPISIEMIRLVLSQPLSKVINFPDGKS
ncbi:hypothetical protein [Klebsiella variicola]|uniref:hypothetical protein n=1 Tax=Klebsiella variicola TaxID=244366 RepID=UPI001F1EB89B|nr:hypothetical protein [Klebsiella variicola]MCE7438926.1 hypothetical protein [Klebsiella variicola]MCJ6488253.1 hypothetical protein [Klebsiella variicola]GKK24446.1 hypothetical protein NUKP38_52480 [Klebsiella variicola]